MSFALTPFQREKLEYYFKFFEPNAKDELDKTSLDLFMKRVVEFTGWEPQSRDAQGTYEVHEAFFEILFDKTSAGEGSSVTLDDWLSVWSNLLPGCMSMRNFPVWLRLLPKTLFRIIDRDNEGRISEKALCSFYHKMVKLDAEEAQTNAKLAYAQMTDNGRYPLNADGYEQIFSNFLLGQTPHGPGRHIFGCFEHCMTPFSLIKPAPEEDDFDMEVKVYLEKRPKRPSVSAI